MPSRLLTTAAGLFALLSCAAMFVAALVPVPGWAVAARLGVVSGAAVVSSVLLTVYLGLKMVTAALRHMTPSLPGAMRPPGERVRATQPAPAPPPVPAPPPPPSCSIVPLGALGANSARLCQGCSTEAAEMTCRAHHVVLCRACVSRHLEGAA
jgi:hypothetical protein